MKKYSLSVICVVLFALLAGCGSKETSNITVDYGDSAVYTEQDMDDAIKVIAAFALRKREAELGSRTRNTHGPGGWLAAMAGNGN